MKYLDIYINHIKSSRTGLTENNLLERCQKECPITLETLRSYTSKLFTAGIIVKNGIRLVMIDKFINEPTEEIKNAIHDKKKDEDKKKRIEKRKIPSRRKDDILKLNTMKTIDTLCTIILNKLSQKSEVSLEGDDVLVYALGKGISINIQLKIE